MSFPLTKPARSQPCALGTAALPSAAVRWAGSCRSRTISWNWPTRREASVLQTPASNTKPSSTLSAGNTHVTQGCMCSICVIFQHVVCLSPLQASQHELVSSRTGAYRLKPGDLHTLLLLPHAARLRTAGSYLMNSCLNMCLHFHLLMDKRETSIPETHWNEGWKKHVWQEPLQPWRSRVPVISWRLCSVDWCWFPLHRLRFSVSSLTLRHFFHALWHTMWHHVPLFQVFNFMEQCFFNSLK